MPSDAERAVAAFFHTTRSRRKRREVVIREDRLADAMRRIREREALERQAERDAWEKGEG